MKQKYMEMNFRASSLNLIDTINAVIKEYQDKGYELTLRQLYYQLVARGYIENTPTSYKNVGNLISNGRLAGLIDWDAIVDRTRCIRQFNHFDNPADVIGAAACSYRLDKWQGQPNYVEVWVEKDALIDIVEKAAGSLDVPCFSCRGYTSQSEMYSAAQRFRKQDYREGRYIIHLGDHDPSGIDMTRDIRERLAMFGADVEVRRAALNMPQIKRYNPPPNPAKTTDKRSAKYIKQYGNDSWELDALDPQVLTDLITGEIMKLINPDIYNSVAVRERNEKNNLEYLSDVMTQDYEDAMELLKECF